MKNLLPILTTIAFTTTNLFAATLEFRYRQTSNGIYKCLNHRDQEGLNYGHLGECGQVSGMSFNSPSLHLWIPGLQSIGSEYQTADFSGSYFVDSDFTSARMENADLSRILIRRSKFTGSSMARISLKGAMVTQASFSGADLSASQFAESSLSQSHFDDCGLKGANFKAALLTQIDFSKANLAGANFADSSLTGVNFRGADLRGSDFTGALLANDIIWERAQYDSATRLPFPADEAREKGMIKR